MTKIDSLLAILPSCEKILKFLLQSFAGSSHFLGGCSSLASIIIVILFLFYNISAPPSVSNCNQLPTDGIAYIVI